VISRRRAADVRVHPATTAFWWAGASSKGRRLSAARTGLLRNTTSPRSPTRGEDRAQLVSMPVFGRPVDRARRTRWSSGSRPGHLLRQHELRARRHAVSDVRFPSDFECRSSRFEQLVQGPPRAWQAGRTRARAWAGASEAWPMRRELATMLHEPMEVLRNKTTTEFEAEGPCRRCAARFVGDRRRATFACCAVIGARRQPARAGWARCARSPRGRPLWVAAVPLSPRIVAPPLLWRPTRHAGGTA